MPATKVPCVHARLSARAHVPLSLPGASRMVAPARSGWSNSIGPSINATVVSAPPWLRSIKGESPTSSRGLIGAPYLPTLITDQQPRRSLEFCRGRRFVLCYQTGGRKPEQFPALGSVTTLPPNRATSPLFHEIRSFPGFAYSDYNSLSPPIQEEFFDLKSSNLIRGVCVAKN